MCSSVAESCALIPPLAPSPPVSKAWGIGHASHTCPLRKHAKNGRNLTVFAFQRLDEVFDQKRLACPCTTCQGDSKSFQASLFRSKTVRARACKVRGRERTCDEYILTFHDLFLYHYLLICQTDAIIRVVLGAMILCCSTLGCLTATRKSQRSEAKRAE
jgi:hypothetical protein